MEGLCNELEDPMSALRMFADRFSPDLVQTLCQQTEMLPGDLMFNPFEECIPLLQSWLKYRGIVGTDGWDRADLATVASKDMFMRRNRPSFKDFLTFSPGNATDNFLAQWLSWYGLGSATIKPRKWWEQLTSTTQAMIPSARKKNKKKITNARRGFGVLLENRRSMDQAYKFLQCIGLYLAFEDRAVVPAQKKKIRQQMEQTSKKVSMAGNMDVKQAFAFLLRASAVAVPIVWNKSQNIVKFATDDMSTKMLTMRAVGEKAAQQIQANAAKSGVPILTNFAGDKLARVLEIKNTKLVSKVGTEFIKAFASKQGFTPYVIDALISSQMKSNPIADAVIRNVLLPAIMGNK
jgi:hypothetical protein